MLHTSTAYCCAVSCVVLTRSRLCVIASLPVVMLGGGQHSEEDLQRLEQELAAMPPEQQQQLLAHMAGGGDLDDGEEEEDEEHEGGADEAQLMQALQAQALEQQQPAGDAPIGLEDYAFSDDEAAEEEQQH